MMPRTKSEWKALAIEVVAAGVVLTFVGGCLAVGALVVARVASCVVGGV